MFFLSSLVLVAVALTAVNAEWVRMESGVNQFESRHWSRQQKLSNENTVKAIFVLKSDPENRRKFEENLLDISAPKSKNYGKWLSLTEVKAMRAVKEENAQRVLKYLESFGVSGIVSKMGDLIRVEMPVAVASSMLNTGTLICDFDFVTADIYFNILSLSQSLPLSAL